MIILSLQEVLKVLEEKLVFHQKLDVGTVETTERKRVFVSQDQAVSQAASPYLSVSSMASSSSTVRPQDWLPPP